MKNLKKILFSFLFLSFLLTSSLLGQGWEKIYTDSIFDYSYSRIEATSNGGFVAIYGLENWPDGDLQMSQFDIGGNILWTRSYNIHAYPHDFRVIGDTSYLCATAFNVLKTDLNGNLEWNKFDYPIPGDHLIAPRLKLATQTNQDEIVISANDSSDKLPFIIYETEDSLHYNLIDLDTSVNPLTVNSFIHTMDNHLLFFGRTPGENFNDVLLVKTNFKGDTIWTRQHHFSADYGENLIELNDGSFAGIIYSSGPINHRFLKFDIDGNEIYSKILTNTSGFGGSDKVITPLKDSGFILFWNDNGEPRMQKIDSLGNHVWTKQFGSPIRWERIDDIFEAENGDIYAIGLRSSNNSFLGHKSLYIINIDPFGNSWTNYIQGNIFYDSSGDCFKDSLELTLEGWIVSAINSDNTNIFYGLTDAQGNYEIRTDIGDYTVHAHIPNAYWRDSCLNDTLISMPNNFDTVTIDFPIRAQYECPIINVDVSTPYLRRCFSNIYYVSYCNEGSVPEDNAYIEVQFDEWLTIDSSSIPGTQSSVDSQLYIFDIGNIGVGECGGFQVYVTLDCDSTVLGQTHCVTAHSYPDSICLPPNTNWDGSTISVEGECLGDSIRFTIENIGINPMSESKSYIVIEDIVIHLNGTFQLGPSESIDVQFPIDTAHTYRMEAEQSSNHPTSTAPSVTIEGCGTVNPLSLGFVNQYSEDDADPFVSIDCQENRGSYDPNDKRGFPSGIGDDHIIFDHTELEYHIRFQNTGTDTAFLVVIRDTLSSFLDPATVRPGASSHPYTWTLQNNGALKFTFENIMLPDSNINEAASHGFVKFKIAQREGNEPGTIINNQAGIYFDFNAPIITNQTTHKILEPMMHSGTDTLYFCNDTTYTQDTTIITQSPQLSWDVETTISIILSSPYETTIDSTIYTLSDTTTYNVFDTTLIQYFTSIEGCDSIVTININYLVNNIDLENPISDIQFFPNPVYHQGSLVIEIKEATEFSFILRNSLGQEVGQNKFNQKLMTGKNTVPIKMSDLPVGVYWLQVSNKKGGKVVKIIIR